MGIDGQVRTDPKFPTGFMDVIQIEKTGENFRIIYDVKGRFTVHRITAQEAKYKLCKVREFNTGNLCMITGGRNTGRVGTIMSRERHQGSFDIVHVKDSAGHVFATRLAYVFLIGKGNKPYVSLPK